MIVAASPAVGAVTGTLAVKGNVSGGEQELSRQSWTFTAPVMTSPLPAELASIGARQTTVPECSSTLSPTQPGTSVMVRTWGARSGLNGPAGNQGDSGTTVIRVGLGPPGF